MLKPGLLIMVLWVAVALLLSASLNPQTGQAFAPMPKLGQFVRIANEDSFSSFIVGQVIDQAGRPIAKAEVCGSAFNLPWTGPEPCGVSDRRGRFKLHVWRKGRYTVWFEKETDGYPCATNAFYGDAFGELPTINVTEPGKIYRVIVKARKKAGRIVGRFTDEETGKPIEIAMVEFCRANDPKRCWSISTGFPIGRFHFLTPDGPFTMKVSIWREGEWRACELSGKKQEDLNVELNQTRRLDMKLRVKPR